MDNKPPVYAFGSKVSVPRFQEQKNITPGPGEYDPNACIGFEAWSKNQPSAGFVDSRERFIQDCLGFADGINPGHHPRDDFA